LDLAINSATNASLNHFHTAAARPMCCVKPCMQTRVCKAEYYSMTHVIDYLCADVSIKIAYCRMPHILGFVCRGMQARQRTAVCLMSQVICVHNRARKAAYCSTTHAFTPMCRCFYARQRSTPWAPAFPLCHSGRCAF